MLNLVLRELVFLHLAQVLNGNILTPDGDNPVSDSISTPYTVLQRLHSYT